MANPSDLPGLESPEAKAASARARSKLGECTIRYFQRLGVGDEIHPEALFACFANYAVALLDTWAPLLIRQVETDQFSRSTGELIMRIVRVILPGQNDGNPDDNLFPWSDYWPDGSHFADANGVWEEVLAETILTPWARHKGAASTKLPWTVVRALRDPNTRKAFVKALRRR